MTYDSVVVAQAGAGGGKYVMRDLMRVLEQEKHAYSDPVTEVSITSTVTAIFNNNSWNSAACLDKDRDRHCPWILNFDVAGWVHG